MREIEFRKWLEAAAKDSGKKVSESNAYAGIVSDEFLKDPLCALQLGYAVLMGKPIILMVDEKVSISSTLEKVAQAIVRVDLKDPSSLAKANETLQKFLRDQVC